MRLRDLFAYCSDEAFICIETIRYLVTQLSFFFFCSIRLCDEKSDVLLVLQVVHSSHPFFWLVYLVTFEVLNLGLANTSQKVRCGRIALREPSPPHEYSCDSGLWSFLLEVGFC